MPNSPSHELLHRCALKKRCKGTCFYLITQALSKKNSIKQLISCSIEDFYLNLQTEADYIYKRNWLKKISESTKVEEHTQYGKSRNNKD